MKHGVPYQVEELVGIISQCTRTFFKTDEKPEPDFSWNFQSADLLFFRSLCVRYEFLWNRSPYCPDIFFRKVPQRRVI
jgi:hypothetical protein